MEYVSPQTKLATIKDMATEFHKTPHEAVPDRARTTKLLNMLMHEVEKLNVSLGNDPEWSKTTVDLNGPSGRSLSDADLNKLADIISARKYGGPLANV